MFNIVGRSFTPVEFAAYVASLDLAGSGFKPEFVVLHNTGAPNLSQRPDGFTSQHMENMRDFYANTQRWHGGPHVFVDDKPSGIWVFNPLTQEGVHSPSWNHIAYGVEMLGDFDYDQFGGAARGQNIRANAVAAIAVLCHARGIDSQTLRLHKEDPETTHRDCPGKHVDKGDMVKRIHDYIVSTLR